MATEFPSFQHGEMKVNIFFKKGTDVGAIADTLLDTVGGFTAFNHATEHRATNKKELHVARSEDLNLFTDYETFITVDPLTNLGEDKAALVITFLSNGEDMTHIDAHPLVVKL
jgi:hypothetical protein